MFRRSTLLHKFVSRSKPGDKISAPVVVGTSSVNNNNDLKQQHQQKRPSSSSSSSASRFQQRQVPPSKIVASPPHPPPSPPSTTNKNTTSSTSSPRKDRSSSSTTSSSNDNKNNKNIIQIMNYFTPQELCKTLGYLKLQGRHTLPSDLRRHLREEAIKTLDECQKQLSQHKRIVETLLVPQMENNNNNNNNSSSSFLIINHYHHNPKYHHLLKYDSLKWSQDAAALGAIFNAAASFGAEQHSVIGALLTSSYPQNHDNNKKTSSVEGRRVPMTVKLFGSSSSSSSSSSPSSLFKLRDALQIVNSLIRLGYNELYCPDRRMKIDLGSHMLKRSMDELLLTSSSSSTNRNQHQQRFDHWKLQQLAVTTSITTLSSSSSSSHTNNNNNSNNLLQMTSGEEFLIELSKNKDFLDYIIQDRLPRIQPQQQQQQNDDDTIYNNNQESFVPRLHRRDLSSILTILSAFSFLHQNHYQQPASSSSSSSSAAAAAAAAVVVPSSVTTAEKVLIDFLKKNLDSLAPFQLAFLSSCVKRIVVDRQQEQANEYNIPDLVDTFLSITENDSFKHKVSLNAAAYLCEALSELVFFCNNNNTNNNNNSFVSSDSSYQIYELIDYSLELLVKRLSVHDSSVTHKEIILLVEASRKIMYASSSGFNGLPFSHHQHNLVYHPEIITWSRVLARTQSILLTSRILSSSSSTHQQQQQSPSSTTVAGSSSLTTTNNTTESELILSSSSVATHAEVESYCSFFEISFWLLSSQSTAVKNNRDGSKMKEVVFHQEDKTLSSPRNNSNNNSSHINHHNNNDNYYDPDEYNHHATLLPIKLFCTGFSNRFTQTRRPSFFNRSKGELQNETEASLLSDLRKCRDILLAIRHCLTPIEQDISMRRRASSSSSSSSDSNMTMMNQNQHHHHLYDILSTMYSAENDFHSESIVGSPLSAEAVTAHVEQCVVKILGHAMTVYNISATRNNGNNTNNDGTYNKNSNNVNPKFDETFETVCALGVYFEKFLSPSSSSSSSTMTKNNYVSPLSICLLDLFKQSNQFLETIMMNSNKKNNNNSNYNPKSILQRIRAQLLLLESGSNNNNNNQLVEIVNSQIIRDNNNLHNFSTEFLISVVSSLVQASTTTTTTTTPSSSSPPPPSSDKNNNNNNNNDLFIDTAKYILQNGIFSEERIADREPLCPAVLHFYASLVFYNDGDSSSSSSSSSSSLFLQLFSCIPKEQYLSERMLKMTLQQALAIGKISTVVCTVRFMSNVINYLSSNNDDNINASSSSSSVPAIQVMMRELLGVSKASAAMMMSNDDSADDDHYRNNTRLDDDDDDDGSGGRGSTAERGGSLSNKNNKKSQLQPRWLSSLVTKNALSSGVTSSNSPGFASRDRERKNNTNTNDDDDDVETMKTYHRPLMLPLSVSLLIVELLKLQRGQTSRLVWGEVIETARSAIPSSSNDNIISSTDSATNNAIAVYSLSDVTTCLRGTGLLSSSTTTTSSLSHHQQQQQQLLTTLERSHVIQFLLPVIRHTANRYVANSHRTLQHMYVDLLYVAYVCEGMPSLFLSAMASNLFFGNSMVGINGSKNAMMQFLSACYMTEIYIPTLVKKSINNKNKNNNNNFVLLSATSATTSNNTDSTKNITTTASSEDINNHGGDESSPEKLLLSPDEQQQHEEVQQLQTNIDDHHEGKDNVASANTSSELIENDDVVEEEDDETSSIVEHHQQDQQDLQSGNNNSNNDTSSTAEGDDGDYDGDDLSTSSLRAADDIGGGADSSSSSSSVDSKRKLSSWMMPRSVSFIVKRLLNEKFLNLSRDDLVTLVAILGSRVVSRTSPSRSHRSCFNLMQLSCVILLQFGTSLTWSQLRLIVHNAERDWVCQSVSMICAEKLKNERILEEEIDEKSINNSSNSKKKRELIQICGIASYLSRYTYICQEQDIWNEFAKFIQRHWLCYNNNNEATTTASSSFAFGAAARISCTLLTIASKVMLPETITIAKESLEVFKKHVIIMSPSSTTTTNATSNIIHPHHQQQLQQVSTLCEALNPLLSMPSELRNEAIKTCFFSFLYNPKFNEKMMMMIRNTNNTSTNVSSTLVAPAANFINSLKSSNIVHLVSALQFSSLPTLLDDLRKMLVLLPPSSMMSKKNTEEETNYFQQEQDVIFTMRILKVVESILDRLDLLLPSVRGKQLAICCSALSQFSSLPPSSFSSNSSASVDNNNNDDSSATRRRTIIAEHEEDLKIFSKKILARCTLLMVDPESGCTDTDLFAAANAIAQSQSTSNNSSNSNNNSNSKKTKTTATTVSNFDKLVKHRIDCVLRGVLFIEEDLEAARINNEDVGGTSLPLVRFSQLGQYEGSLSYLIRTGGCDGLHSVLKNAMLSQESPVSEGGTIGIIKLCNWAKRRKVSSEFVTEELWKY